MNRIKIVGLCFLFLILATAGHSQYYYNDFVAAKQAAMQYKALKDNNIKRVTATSFERNGEAAEDFSLEQTISPGAAVITVKASYPSAGNTQTINTYKDGLLQTTEEKSSNVSTTSTYTYHDAGNIASITTQTEDTFMNSRSTEVHQWVYGDSGEPTQMLKIKDGTDTTVVTLLYEDGNVAQELWKRKGQVVESFFYYYNANGQLTDIVRYNARVKKMLPEYVYDYDAGGRVVKMMQVPAGRSDYLIWQYVYNNKGLKEKELLYNKQQQPVGRIEYSYE